MSNKIELMRLCGVLQSNFSCLSQSESRTQPCHVRICHKLAFQLLSDLLISKCLFSQIIICNSREKIVKI